MLNKVPDIYLALGLFVVLLAVWWFRPEQFVEGMLTTIFGAVIGFLKGRSDASQDQRG